jgi:hypothetical protein
MTMSALPDDATRAVARIEALLDEANRLIERTGIRDESAFSLAETERRYLPDTLSAYLDIPASRRDATADALLVDQLLLLERATTARLAALAEAGRSALAANGAFLAERFSDTPAALPELGSPDSAALPATVRTESTALGGAPPRALVARFFSDMQAPGRGDPAQVLQLAGQRFSAVFPALTTVRRGLFGGPVKSVSVDVPRGADLLRYTLESERGGVAAACTKIVRGVALRTERIDLGEWMRGLLEDVGAYVERDRASHDLLTRFLSG